MENNEMKKPIPPVVDIDGLISSGTQFDIDITLPEDHRDVIFGFIKDCYRNPVADAVVKLIEVICEDGKDKRIPVSHTFTDKEGEFVFGPLCPGKYYEIQIWVNNVKNVKLCAKTSHEGRCLKGNKNEKCDYFFKDKDEKNCDCEKK